MKNLFSILKSVSFLAILVLLFIQCGNGSSEQTEKLTPGGDPVPTNGFELVDFIVDKAAIRFSLNEVDQDAIRDILKDVYQSKYGELESSIPFDEVRDMQRRVFMESSEKIKHYMNTERDPG
jgi:hypothetical protein